MIPSQSTVHRVFNYVPHAFKEAYLFLVITGLSAHTGALWLSMMLVPKYARELNPIATSTGMLGYFPITIMVSIVAYFWIWRNSVFSKRNKLLLATLIAGISVIDFLSDFNVLLNVAATSGFS